VCGEDIARDAHRWIHDETVDVVHEVMPRVVRAIPVHEVELQRVVGLLLRVVAHLVARRRLQRGRARLPGEEAPFRGPLHRAVRGSRASVVLFVLLRFDVGVIALLRLRLEAFLVLVVFVRVLARVLVVVGGAFLLLLLPEDAHGASLLRRRDAGDDCRTWGGRARLTRRALNQTFNSSDVVYVYLQGERLSDAGSAKIDRRLRRGCSRSRRR
jgi:hypothetical protein